MEQYEFTYKCEGCGECCKNWNPAQYDSTIVDEDGVCIYLDKTTNLCTIYDTRPDFCRIGLWYEKNHTFNMPFEKYLEKQIIGCETLKKMSSRSKNYDERNRN